MAEVQEPTGASAKDTALMTLSITALVAGIVAFYWYEDQSLTIRVAMVVAGWAAAAALIWFSWYGREFRQFAVAARVELRKVVWPEREETIKTTYVVFIFAIVMGLFFWGLDWVLTWLIRLLTGQPPA
ncbi:MAG: preprotein translocase subunit SecE [Steroidobacteraceae bacterium]|jgi:preprotein translocase subunit SecE